MSQAAPYKPVTRRAPGESLAQGEEQGWFERMLARLGLAEAPDLRHVIEAALEREQASSRSFSPQERAMLLNLLRFGALKVEDVMVPRADIIAVDDDAPLYDLLTLFEQAGHSRIPVYRETLDDPRGMVHIKDLMSWIISRAKARIQRREAAAPASDAKAGPHPAAGIDLSAADLSLPVGKANIQRDVMFVPPSMSVLDLLVRMQSTRMHLALVVDEYGGTDGLVSIEDLVEEIVGEIEDEHDINGGPYIREDPKLGLVADARAPIEELEAHLGHHLLPPERDEDVDTLGGLVFTLVGRVPTRGELVRHESGVEFEVLDADLRRIKKLRIHNGRKAASPPETAGGAAEPEAP